MQLHEGFVFVCSKGEKAGKQCAIPNFKKELRKNLHIQLFWNTITTQELIKETALFFYYLWNLVGLGWLGQARKNASVTFLRQPRAAPDLQRTETHWNVFLSDPGADSAHGQLHEPLEPQCPTCLTPAARPLGRRQQALPGHELHHQGPHATVNKDMSEF